MKSAASPSFGFGLITRCPWRTRWNAATIVGNAAIKRWVFRMFASRDASSRSASKLLKYEIAVRRTSMGGASLGISFRRRTISFVIGRAAARSARSSSSSSRLGRRPWIRMKTVSSNVECFARSRMSYPRYRSRPFSPSTRQIVVSFT